MNNKERYFLRALGNSMTPTVTVGKNGVATNVIAQLDEALDSNELVKCRVLPHTDYDVKDVAEELSEATNAEIVQVIGRNILIYRQPKAGKESKLPWQEC